MKYDYNSMTPEEFDSFMREQLNEFKEVVSTHKDYQFSRDGEKMPLGDWFEHFACRANLM